MYSAMVLFPHPAGPVMYQMCRCSVLGCSFLDGSYFAPLDSGSFDGISRLAAILLAVYWGSISCREGMVKEQV